MMKETSLTGFMGAPLLKAIGNQDALSILFYCKEGVSSSREVINELGLTQKRFYSRLKDLIDNGLIEHSNGVYQHTALGKIVFEIGFQIENLLINKEQLELIDSIRRSSSITSKETREIAKALQIEIPFFGETGKVKMIESYEKLVDELCNCIENSKYTFHIASKYVDPKVTDVTLQARERGVLMHLLIEKISMQNLSAFKLLLSPKILTQFTKLFTEFKTMLRQVNRLPYSFSIIDGKTSILEISHPNMDTFYLAFVIENEKTSQKLEKIFLDMWNAADPFKLF